MKLRALVMAKAPVPGQAKTRLAAHVGTAVAADLAAAALLDTLDAVETAFPTTRPVVALTGSMDHAARRDELSERFARCTMVDQRGPTFAHRLANAHADLAGQPVVQIGMDTPHIGAKDLVHAARDLLEHEAVLGPAEDGGWWLLGLRDPREAGALAGVPMSQPDTGARTLRALGHLDVAVTLGTYDVDTYQEAERAATDAPGTRFARTWWER